MSELPRPRYLLDTHVLYWWYADAPRLSARYGKILAEADGGMARVAISAITLWELAKLSEIGRLKFTAPLEECLAEIEENPAIDVLPITSRIAADSIRLGAKFPRDPADQIIAATARRHSLTLLTADDPIRRSGAVPVG